MLSTRFARIGLIAASASASFFSSGLLPSASAHEAYVLDGGYFWGELQKPVHAYAFDALKDPGNLRTAFFAAIGIAAIFMLNFLFRRSSAGRKVHRALDRFASFGPLFVRAAIAASFFFSALGWNFLGPELSLEQMPAAQLVRILLFAISIFIAVGIFTEIAACIALVLFAAGIFSFGPYLLNYLNYLGEIIALLFFGTRKWSLDALFFGASRLAERWKKYETVIVRVCYGIALAYAAISVKFLHPQLTLKVINDWNLTQFHWLFPSDPLLVVLGAGIVELAIGLFIVFGFELRLTVFVTLIYATLSLFYFRELLWPHLMLYGISLSLLIQPEAFTLDRFLSRKKQ